jgi:hypothetical protein
MGALPPLSVDQPALYRIEVQGCLGEENVAWLGDATLEVREGESVITTLVAHVADQAELYGILQTLYSLGLPLLSLRRQA